MKFHSSNDRIIIGRIENESRKAAGGIMIPDTRKIKMIESENLSGVASKKFRANPKEHNK